MEVSNNLLTVLVILAMGVSLVGTGILLSEVSQPFTTFTGFGTTQQTGTTNVTLAQEVSISLLVTSLDFGNLPLQGSNATKGLIGGSIHLHPLVLQNVGTIETNVSLCWRNSTNTAAGDQLWLTEPGSSSYYFQYNATKNQTTTTAVWYGGQGESDYLSNVPVNGSNGWCATNPANLVYNLSESSNQDKINIEFNVTAPASEPSGVKGVVIRFTAGPG